MDAAAGAMAFASIAIQLGQSFVTLYKFWESIKEAPADVSTIVQDLKLLASILRHIKLNEQKYGQDPEVTDVLNSCMAKVDTLRNLVEELEPGFATKHRLQRKTTTTTSTEYCDGEEKWIALRAEIQRKASEMSNSVYRAGDEHAMDYSLRQFLSSMSRVKDDCRFNEKEEAIGGRMVHHETPRISQRETYRLRSSHEYNTENMFGKVLVKSTTCFKQSNNDTEKDLRENRQLYKHTMPLLCAVANTSRYVHYQQKIDTLRLLSDQPEVLDEGLDFMNHLLWSRAPGHLGTTGNGPIAAWAAGYYFSTFIRDFRYIFSLVNTYDSLTKSALFDTIFYIYDLEKDPSIILMLVERGMLIVFEFATQGPQSALNRDH
ncbi:hypothetical protein MMC18_006633 [Xylographa bjoerkii]|nr:hypothetical protein [Xylographa bjoerkii]